MQNFEYDYKVMAQSELDREIREIEERKKKLIRESNIKKDVDMINGKINFAECINLINTTQGENYRKRLEKAIREFEIMQRNEYQSNVVDDFENPHERTLRYFNMEKINADISSKRANSNNKKEAKEVKTVIKKEYDKKVR